MNAKTIWPRSPSVPLILIIVALVLMAVGTRAQRAATVDDVAVFKAVIDQLARRDLRTRGWASFALPAFASSGEAVVYARYICGGLCGTSWYFLLEKSANGWRVIDEKVAGSSRP